MTPFHFGLKDASKKGDRRQGNSDKAAFGRCDGARYREREGQMEAQLARRDTSIHSKVCNGWPDHARPREQTKERTNGSAGGFFLWPLISPSDRGKSEAEFRTRKLTHFFLQEEKLWSVCEGAGAM